jgi:hypothetical protein
MYVHMSLIACLPGVAPQLFPVPNARPAACRRACPGHYQFMAAREALIARNQLTKGHATQLPCLTYIRKPVWRRAGARRTTTEGDAQAV